MKKSIIPLVLLAFVFSNALGQGNSGNNNGNGQSTAKVFDKGIIVNGTTTLNDTVFINRNNADAWMIFSNPSVINYSMGIDFDNAGAFTINKGTSLGQNTPLILTNSGLFGIGTQPNFALDLFGDFNLTGDIRKNGSVLPSMSITEQIIADWNTAYEWGNHASFGYINEQFLVENNYLKLDNSLNLNLPGGIIDNNITTGSDGQILASTGTGIIWVDSETAGQWKTETQSVGTYRVAVSAKDPNVNIVDLTYNTDNSEQALTQFIAKNINDQSNYAGALFVAKGSGPEFTNNMYMGKYSKNFYIDSWAGNGVVATDQDMVLAAVGSTDAQNPNPDPEIIFQTGGGYQNTGPITRMVLDENGNLGIGAENPQAKLDVNGDILLRNNETNTGELKFSSHTNDAFVGFKAPYEILENIIWTLPGTKGNAEQVLSTDGNGNLNWSDKTNSLWTVHGYKQQSISPSNIDYNVGIGTTNPSAVFEVNKNTNDLWTAYIKNGGGTAKGMRIKSGWEGSTTPILQLEDNAENVRMKVQSNGLIGIGTDEPEHLLTVEGTIGAQDILVSGTLNAQQVIITIDEWKDEVFEPNYPLMSIRELEQFINTHKHLPDIPSETEIIAKGMETGEIVKQQMQKIEELTLYIIEQNKRIEKLEQALSEIENK